MLQSTLRRKVTTVDKKKSCVGTGLQAHDDVTNIDSEGVHGDADTESARPCTYTNTHRIKASEAANPISPPHLRTSQGCVQQTHVGKLALVCANTV